MTVSALFVHQPKNNRNDRKTAILAYNRAPRINAQACYHPNHRSGLLTPSPIRSPRCLFTNPTIHQRSPRRDTPRHTPGLEGPLLRVLPAEQRKRLLQNRLQGAFVEHWVVNSRPVNVANVIMSSRRREGAAPKGQQPQDHDALIQHGCT